MRFSKTRHFERSLLSFWQTHFFWLSSRYSLDIDRLVPHLHSNEDVLGILSQFSRLLPQVALPLVIPGRVHQLFKLDIITHHTQILLDLLDIKVSAKIALNGFRISGSPLSERGCSHQGLSVDGVSCRTLGAYGLALPKYCYICWLHQAQDLSVLPSWRF